MKFRGACRLIGRLRQWWAFRHHRDGGTNVLRFIDSSIDDLDVLQILLNDLFASEFDVLLSLTPGAFTNPIEEMFFDQDTNLLG